MLTSRESAVKLYIKPICRNSHYRNCVGHAHKSEDLTDAKLKHSLGKRRKRGIVIHGEAMPCVIFCVISLFGGFSFYHRMSLNLKIKRRDKMKNLKRITAVFLMLVLLVSLPACNKNDDAGSVTVVLGEKVPVEFTVDLSKLEETNGLVAVLNYLKETENLTFEMNGTMIDKVGNIKNDASSGTYIYIYTSVAADQDVSEYKCTVDYKGQTLTSAGVGAGELHMEDGAIIYIGTVVWN